MDMGAKALVIATLISIAAAFPADAWSQKPLSQAISPNQGLVKSKADLDRYLKATTGSSSPLDRLSPLARKRFLDSLDFRDGALVSYNPTDLAAELTGDEIRQVLGIFGEEPYEQLLEIARPAPRTTPSSTAPSPIERRFDAFSRISDSRAVRSEKERSASIAKAYNELLSEYATQAGELNDQDLELTYRAAQTNAFYSPTPNYARGTLNLLMEMQSRSLSRKSDFEDVYRALTGARLFDEARDFAVKHPSSSLKPLPQLHDMSGPAAATAWVVSPDKRELSRQPIDLRKPAQVIVVSSPGCYFSQNAARDIRNDPVLAKLFREHAIWLNPPLGMTDFDAVQDWNREHPNQTMMIAYAKQDWPMFENWGTPVFYIFKDGQLAETVTGWPSREGHDALAKALGKVGLMQSASK